MSENCLRHVDLIIVGIGMVHFVPNLVSAALITRYWTWLTILAHAMVWCDAMWSLHWNIEILALKVVCYSNMPYNITLYNITVLLGRSCHSVPGNCYTTFYCVTGPLSFCFIKQRTKAYKFNICFVHLSSFVFTYSDCGDWEPLVAGSGPTLLQSTRYTGHCLCKDA